MTLRELITYATELSEQFNGHADDLPMAAKENCTDGKQIDIAHIVLRGPDNDCNLVNTPWTIANQADSYKYLNS